MKRNILPFAIGGAVLVLLIGFIVWLFTPRYVDAKVQSVMWTGTVQVERFVRIPDSGWYAPNKNGSASCSGGRTKRECSNRTVNDYREEPRYQMWYSWYVWRWRHNRNVQSSGTNLQPYEPTEVQIALNSGCFGREQERRSLAEFKYQCTFLGNDGKTQTYNTKLLHEFKQCVVGKFARLKFVAGSMSVERWE